MGHHGSVIDGRRPEQEEIAFQRRNFMLLDSQRYFVADSFDFMVESVGVHSNMAIFKTACQVLLGQFEALGSALESGRATILPSTTTTPHCFDFLVEDNDYTVGPVLEYFVYHKYFLSLKEVTYCGFKKFHPHNNDATLRMAIKEEEEETEGNEDDDDMNGVQTNGGQAEGDKQANGNQMGGDQVGGQAKDDEDNVENRITSDIKKNGNNCMVTRTIIVNVPTIFWWMHVDCRFCITKRWWILFHRRHRRHRRHLHKTVFFL